MTLTLASPVVQADPALSVPCPFCGAGEGQECHYKRLDHCGLPLPTTHISRRLALKLKEEQL